MSAPRNLLRRCLAVGLLAARSPEPRAFASLPRASGRRRYADDKFVKPDMYKVFRDDDSSVILDVDEERALLDSRDAADRQPDARDVDDRFAGLNTSRGITGVFEIEQLVEVLEKTNALNVFVASVPANKRYVDYIVVASGKSPKHLMSIVEYAYKLYKIKRNPTDILPKLVNKKPLDWVALDMGNIALHLITKSTRKSFDLETIWSVGEKYDSHLNKPTDSLVSLLNEHSFSLDDLEPVDVKNTNM